MNYVQTLTNNQKDKIYEHYVGLDHEALRYRFGIKLSNAALKHFVQRLDVEKDTHFCIFSGERIVALCNLAKVSDDEPDVYELGISVYKEIRRKGAGSMLWDATINYALENNIQEVRVQYVPNNNPMATFCRNKGLRLTRIDGEYVGVWENPNYIPEIVEQYTDTLNMV